MFEIIFGIFWLFVTAMVSVGFLMATIAGGTEGFGIFVFLFLGIFWAIGIFVLCKGIKRISIDRKTKKYGKNTYGLIINIRPNGNSVNGNPQLQADVLTVVDNGRINRYSEVIGFDWNKFQVGDFIEIKHYQNDINIIGFIDRYRVPTTIVEMLEEKQPKAKRKSEQNTYTEESAEDNYDWSVSDVWNEYPTYVPKSNTEKAKKKDTVILNGVEYTRKN